MNIIHTPVMPHEVIHALAPRKSGVYLDGTAGLGGHSELLLEAGATVYCLDRDQNALEKCKERLKRFGDKAVFLHGNHSEMDKLLDPSISLDGILLDLGVSSMQLDEPERGFSYRHDAPLDMRMDQTQARTAAEVVNEWSYRELIRILIEYGEERYAKQIARGIVFARPLKTTAELAEVILESMPAKGRREAQHPARRTFQAIRIAVNGELESLEETLPKALRMLNYIGRMAVISFHSLEDRIVKRVFAEAAKGCICPPAFPACVCGRRPAVRITGRWKPTRQEIESNPRSASAVLRGIERI
ncbi:MAG: 16S rRNA (cytosine(1402)-N(4))-methyltransferase RsmH [Oscillospiraceae bacterium]|nr:16S rRNA (cytosine(1402)-N(4))-methyltransferase RsmH [Oscillospiraceae bacterium]